MDVVVVGGGIGGLADALALSRAGLPVRVLDPAGPVVAVFDREPCPASCTGGSR